MVESGLHRISMGEWLPQYDAVPWPQEQLKGNDHTDGPNVFSHLLPVVQATLGRDGRVDYYGAVRAASFIADMREQQSAVKRGGVAYALSMVKVGSDYKPDYYMGVEIVRSMVELEEWLQIPPETIQYMNSALERQSQASYPPSAAILLRDWLERRQGEQPLMDWLAEEARKAEEKYPL